MQARGYFMSDEVEDAAKWKIVDDYQRCKAKLAALISEADKHASAIRGIAERLNPTATGQSTYSSQSVPNPYSSGKAIELLVERYPTAERIRQILSDLHATFEQKTELQNRLKDLGLDLRS
jgi:Txe/YoeB family toxin of Txe-Axe toxin-antitoxin module